MRDSGLCCEGPKVRAASFARSWGWEGKLLLLTLAGAQDPVSLAALSRLRAPVHRVLLGDSPSLAARQYECSLSLVICIVQKMPFVANVHLSHFLGCFSDTDAGIRSFAFVGVFTSACLLGV